MCCQQYKTKDKIKISIYAVFLTGLLSLLAFFIIGAILTHRNNSYEDCVIVSINSSFCDPNNEIIYLDSKNVTVHVQLLALVRNRNNKIKSYGMGSCTINRGDRCYCEDYIVNGSYYCRNNNILLDKPSHSASFYLFIFSSLIIILKIVAVSFKIQQKRIDHRYNEL